MKLALFDIDGTLIKHVGDVKSVGLPRWQHVSREVFGKELDIETVSKKSFDGWVDKGILRHMLHEHHVSDQEFEKKWPRVSHTMRSYAKAQANGRKTLYQPFPDAVELATKLKEKNDVRIGLLTGNVERMGWWKIEHAGILNLFGFGVFADDVDDRISLAKTVFERSKKHFNIDFLPKDIVIIGDTIHDVRCGKAIGAITIAVTTGMHSTFVKTKYGHSADPHKKYIEELENEQPDFLVDSLLDPAVCDFFGV